MHRKPNAFVELYRFAATPALQRTQCGASVYLSAAAIIHFVVAPEHFAESWAHGIFFILIGCTQLLYAITLVAPRLWATKPRAFFLSGILGNSALILIYILSRTIGIPIGQHADHIEPVGLIDLLCQLFELAAILLLYVLLFTLYARSSIRDRVTKPPLIPAAILLALLAACGTAPQFTAPTVQPNAHETSEGQTLGTNRAETVYAGALCPANAPVRAYNVVAINIEITLNRFLDYDPLGRMYVLEENLVRVRAEEAQNKDARADKAEPAASLGLQNDAIQPLTLRVNQGECLRVTLRNDLREGEVASLHLHGSSWHLRDSGEPAIATNARAYVAPGKSVTYEWFVDNDEPEGTHYFHSHADERLQTNHGLFGALVVEQKDSEYLDPITGKEMKSGWSAMIKLGKGSAFREFAIFYEEVGDPPSPHLDKNNRPVALVDQYTESYRPGSFALNYRSEPFMNRLALQQQTVNLLDKSSPYSSYSFGDPATPIARSYLGDPVKMRVIHGGADVFHVHHVHGGAIRWRRQPGVESANFDGGLDKHPPLVPAASERVDSQSLGPSETFDEENECGSGGCQQSAGDYLIHCHIANHYLSGMWMIWRVYNTLQTTDDPSTTLRAGSGRTTDGLPSLQELPDRVGRMQRAVSSDKLIGTTVDWYGKKFSITNDNLASWVEMQLPPQGTPKGYDASVLDWKRDGDVYLNEAETDRAWQNYRAEKPGMRPLIYFDPRTGKIAYPYLRPHLGKRPPFAPNHGPAPFLEPFHQGTDPPLPGENGPGSLCPKDAALKPYSINAITLPIAFNPKNNLLDPSGELYVLREEEEQVRADNGRKIPLAIRANAGEDCVDVIFKSELEDGRENFFISKADMHIHFAQFDVQASDGVNTGFNYEQSVRPYAVEGEKLAEDAASGSNRVTLTSAARFSIGAVVGVGMEQDKTFEIKRIQSIANNALVFDSPLKFTHSKNEIVSTEFVRYRWYPDVQFGTAYFHDHVDAIHSWRHGLFGALIAEPPRSTYHDPHSGAEIKSGPKADIHTDRSAKVSADITGSFREFVIFIQDDNQITSVSNALGSTINLRAEPLAARKGDPAQIFNSKIFGDPATPLLETFLGDPLVLRTLVAGTNDVHTLHVDGHAFRAEPWSATSPLINTIHLGISERYDLSIARAGGAQKMPGDYLYYNGRDSKLREGSWGILRVYDGTTSEPLAPTLQKLPGRDSIPAASTICPNDAPLKNFDISAIQAPLPMLGNKPGKIFALRDDATAISSGKKSPEPLVLHINVGDCLQVNLKNETAAPVSFHADALPFDPKDSYGANVGNNPEQMTQPGATRRYTFYASPETGETTALVRDWGNVIENPRIGLYGAVVVAPKGTRFTDPGSGADVSSRARWRVDARPATGAPYRDVTLFMQDEDSVFGTAVMPYFGKLAGVLGLNYRAAPLAKRLEKSKDASKIFLGGAESDPGTPLVEAYAGDAVQLHVLAPSSEQAHVFTIENHRWQFEPGRKGSDLLSSVQVGALEAVRIVLADGAGGKYALPGDYLYGDHRLPYREAGLWGIFRVYPKDAKSVKLLPLK